jgi:uncharacterized protein (TIGR03000 family)
MKNKMRKFGAIAVLFFALFFLAAPAAEACLLCGPTNCGPCCSPCTPFPRLWTPQCGLLGIRCALPLRCAPLCDPCITPCFDPCFDPCCPPIRPLFPLLRCRICSFPMSGCCCGGDPAYMGTSSCCGSDVISDSIITTVPDGNGPTLATPPADNPPSTIDSTPEAPAIGPSPYGPSPYGPAPDATPATETVSPTTLSENEIGSAVLTVVVPDDAQVFINGAATQTEGVVRQYVSQDLEVGYAYDYQILVQVVREGRLVQQTQEVTLQQGQDQRLAFESFPTSNVRVASW